MSKICFIITSSIEVDNNYPIDIWDPNEGRRSDFDSEERYRQLIYTLCNLRLIDKTATYYIAETSIDYEKYYNIEELFMHVGQENTKIVFWPLGKYNQEALRIANTNNNKSYCEGVLLYNFIKENREELLQYDFIIKVSGRYVYEFNINDLKKDKLMFRYARSFVSSGNTRYLYPCTIYAFDTKFTDRVINILEKINNNLGENDETYLHNSMETLLYEYTREYEEDLENMEAITRGFAGITKSYLWF